MVGIGGGVGVVDSKSGNWEHGKIPYLKGCVRVGRL